MSAREGPGQTQKTATPSDTQSEASKDGKTKSKLKEDAKARRMRIKEANAAAIKEFAGGTGEGYFTRRGITMWKQTLKKGTDAGLVADPDPAKPLYFWQLFSILGAKRIVKVVRNFYTRVFADQEADWFRYAFARISGVEHHVNTQACFWIDAMGGGRYYHGGEYRLSIHHSHNAREVMNREGAVLWMKHMRLALEESDLTEDPRVRTTIDEFLCVMLEKYANEFSFEAMDDVYEGFTVPDVIKQKWKRKPVDSKLTSGSGSAASQTQEER